MLVNPYIYGSSNNLVTTLYTGTGASRSIITGQNLSAGGLVWAKKRSAAKFHALCDTVRGATKVLQSNDASEQVTDASTLTSFNSNGFSLESGDEVNTSGADYAAWSFLEKAGFLDVVTYTGNETNRTVSHNLASDVGLLLTKRTTSSGSWVSWHKDLGSDKYLVLDSSSGENTSTTAWNNTAPTSSAFSLGASALANATGQTHIAYLFAHNPSQGIACGTFTTDGSGNATVTGLGFRPKWLLAKTTNGTSGWLILDTARGWGSGNDAQLRANSSDAEIPSGADYGAPTSDGFTWALSTSTTYIYMAIG